MRNLIGLKCNKLTIVSYVGLSGGGQKKKYGIHKGYHTWLCKCECGNETKVREVKLLMGNTKSCGCLKKDVKPSWTLKEGEAAKRWLFRSYKDSARKRDLSFDLTMDSFISLTSENCHYCGEVPLRSVKLAHIGKSTKKSMNGDYLYNGLDRINNDMGYQLSNVVSCCWRCNELKKAKSYGEFVEHICKIAENLKEKYKTNVRYSF